MCDTNIILINLNLINFNLIYFNLIKTFYFGNLYIF